jgi:hypothetical protein
MSLLDRLSQESAWLEYRDYKLLHSCMTQKEFDELDRFIEEKRYLPCAETLCFSLPEKKSINKSGGRKRQVYILPEDEARVLKLLTWLLYRYDASFGPCCYSFRKGYSAKNAFADIFRVKDLKDKYVLKLDIHDYFNSISIPILLPKLREMFSDDPQLYALFERMLTDGRAMADGEVVRENRGVMAGTPTSPFLADIYLMDVDRHFFDAGVVYARYSDDIILFAPDRESLEKHKAVLLDFLKEYELEVNPDKERVYSPDEPFEYLGFRCHGNAIDISEAVRSKMKGKIRRAARSMLRRRAAKGLGAEQAMKGLIRKFNAKFYEGEDPELLSWSRWFFPVINRT